MSAPKKSIQVPTIKELVDIFNACNVARELELRMMPNGGFPPQYAETDAAKRMAALFDCMELAARHLKPVLEANLKIKEP